MRLIASLSILAIAAVAVAATCATESPDRVASVAWGGQHIGMVVSDTGAVIEYDCADGKITQALRLDAHGNFEWAGIHVPGHGGPIRVDEQLASHPARYTGHATNDRMTLTLALLDGSQPAQTFTLTRGAAAGVFRCL